MAMEKPSKPALLISRNGNFKTDIEQHLKLTTDSSKAAVVSIIGMQSTGRSTLLNQLFGTAFKVMDESKGMTKTTEGIWMTKRLSPSGGPPVLVIDTEGSDSRDRREDVTFEKQTALFSLAVSNTVIMNMKCDNVNLHNGGGWSLLQTVFEVMIRKSKTFTPRKVNLVFVLRDENQVPLHLLKEQLDARSKRIWEETFKRQALPEAALEKYFQIKVVTLPHYLKKEFVAEVACLKNRIMRWATSDEKIPASGFVGRAQKIWRNIKQEKDLDLPQHRIMVSGVRCEEIADEKYKSFCKNESWTKIKEQVGKRTKIKKQVGVSPKFGENVSEIYKKYLSKYDADTQHYHHTKRDDYKKRLADNLLKEIEPIYQSLVNHMYQATLQMFQEAALEEIKKTHDLSTAQTEKFVTKFVTEFRNQLKDAAIRPANLDYEKKLVAEIKSEMHKIIESFQAINDILKQQQKDRRKFWGKFVEIWAHMLTVAVSAAVMVLVPGIGTAVGGLTPALWITKKLMKGNQRAQKALPG